MANYVLNAWYMAAWESEIDGDALLARTIIERPILIYRLASGKGYAVMEDRCPHRFAPLSRGRRHGDQIACGYHGLTFDAHGKCVMNPFSSRIPDAAQVCVFPAVARDSIIWFWPGDPARADTATIPDFSYMADGVPRGLGKLTMKANYELLVDNLMDLSHIEFVHTGTFGGAGVIFQGEHSVKEEGDAIWSKWWMPGIAPPPWASFVPAHVKLDHWLEMRWNAPATMSLEIGICPAGQPRHTAPAAPVIGPHIISPETASSSHYFYTYTLADGGRSEDAVGRAFKDEDQPMIEAVQRSMGEVGFWDRKPVLLEVDAGAVQSRRRIAKMLAQENSRPTQPPL